MSSPQICALLRASLEVTVLAIEIVARKAMSRIGDFRADQRRGLGDEIPAVAHGAAPIVVRELVDFRGRGPACGVFSKVKRFD